MCHKVKPTRVLHPSLAVVFTEPVSLLTALPPVCYRIPRRLRLVRFHRVQPDWWALLQASGGVTNGASANGVSSGQQSSNANATQSGTGDSTAGEQQSASAASEAGSWTAPAVGGGRRPGARYEHAVALSEDGGRMYLVGGNCGAALIITLF